MRTITLHCAAIPLLHVLTTYVQFLMTGQPFPDQQQTILANQQHSASNQQYQMVIPNQQHPYQQLQSPPNQRQPIFLQNTQQPIINFDPRQHAAQYHLQQLDVSPYSELDAEIG